MLLRIIAGGALIGSLFALFMAFTSGQPMNFGPAAIQGLVAFAVLMALAEIVDTLKSIAENTKK